MEKSVASVVEHDAAIRNYKRGLATGDVSISNTAYAALVAMGNDAIPNVSSELDRIDPGKIFDPIGMAIFLGLSALLRELGEVESNEYLDRTLDLELHDPLRIALTTIRNFSEKSYRISSHNGIQIWESKELAQKNKATQYLIKWLGHIDEKYLDGINRIYLIPDGLNPEILGYYSPHLSNITLSWRSASHQRISVGLISRLLIRKTLFHEIGHHYYGHGNDDTHLQEVEAEVFAIIQMRKLISKRSILPAIARRLANLLFKLSRNYRQYYVGFYFEHSGRPSNVWFEIVSRDEKFAVLRGMNRLKSEGATNIRLSDIDSYDLEKGKKLKPGIIQEFGRIELSSTS